MGLGFATVGFVVANTILSLLTVLVWRGVRSSRPRAGSLLVLRMLPAIGSAGLVLGLVVPAFWSFEPRATAERPGPALVVFVILAGLLIGAGLQRAIASGLHTRRLEHRWKAAAVSSTSPGLPVIAYRVPSDMPLAALVGVVRPRLFLSGQFLDALSAGERRSVLEHEVGHLRSFDNLKRTMMRLAPDCLGFLSAGAQIERAWAIAAEEDADDHAAGPDRARSLDLAGALLKASRMAPIRCAHASNFCDEGTIARRVARLLNDAPEHREQARPFAPRIAWTLALLGTCAILTGPALRAAYSVTEAAVRLLQ
jgi:beta-lactamase regulating signal transducer with metallopeptidase domain